MSDKKSITVNVSNGVFDTDITFTLTDNRVIVRAINYYIGWYKVSSYGNGKTLNGAWIDDFLSKKDSSIVKW